jgi:hypothetical protein
VSISKLTGMVCFLSLVWIAGATDVHASSTEPAPLMSVTFSPTSPQQGDTVSAFIQLGTALVAASSSNPKSNPIQKGVLK